MKRAGSMRSSKPICFVTKSITRPRATETRCESMSTCNEPGARQALAATEGRRGKRRQWCPGADRQTERWSGNRAQIGWGGHLSPQALSVPTALVSDHLEVIAFPHCQPSASMPWALLVGTPTGRHLAASPGPREGEQLWASLSSPLRPSS